MPSQPFWFLLTWASILWYGVLVILIGWRGFKEIRHMIADLKNRDAE